MQRLGISSFRREFAARWCGRGAQQLRKKPISMSSIVRPAFRLSLAGLLTTMALASLDQNIVSTALPRIVGELGGLAHLPWVITAFMLTATATAPAYGKLSDIARKAA